MTRSPEYLPVISRAAGQTRPLLVPMPMKLARRHIYFGLLVLVAGLAAIIGRSPQVTARLMAQLGPASAE